MPVPPASSRAVDAAAPSSTLKLEIADGVATLALVPIIAWEVLHPGERSGAVEALNWGLFLFLLILGAVRLRMGEWARMSKLHRLTELFLLAVAFPLLAQTAGPLRLFRLSRLPLLGVRSLRGLRQRLIERGSILVGLNAVFTVTVGSLLILEFEKQVQGTKIATLPDALWWAAATMTTVGYGDLAPTTTGGRIVAVVLMFVGITLFGLTTALLAKWLVGDRPETSMHSELEGLRAELVAMREALVKPDPR